MYLALNQNTNDLILKEGGGVERVEDGRYTIQQVRCALKTRLTEYYPKPSVGWIHLLDFKHNPDLYSIESRAREIILNTLGVFSIADMSLTKEGRDFLLTFTAKTEYGEISDTIPWTTGA